VIDRIFEVPRQCLYHYSDARGLEGILRTGEIHATDLRFMNDAGELHYGQSLIRDVAEQQLHSCTDRIRSAFSVVPSSLQDLSFRFYASCFCEDSDVLSQWRAYGNAGGGYAIGFDFNALISVMREAGHARSLQRVDYNLSSQKTRVGRAFAEFIRIANRCETEFKEHPECQAAVDYCASSASLFLVLELSRMKHPAFREEQEFRIVEIASEAPKNFRVSRSGLLVPFIKLVFGGADSEPRTVAELRWGPTQNPALAHASLDTYAAALGYKGVRLEGSLIRLRA